LHNAFKVLLNVPDYSEATYIEGMAISKGKLLLEHGWIEKDREIIDPTLSRQRHYLFSGFQIQRHSWNIESSPYSER